jgi:hypothetical protein
MMNVEITSFELIIGIVNTILIILLLVIFLVKNKNKLDPNDPEKYVKILRVEYDKGFADAKKQQNWEVQISSWKEDIEDGVFFKTKTVQIGYQYQLFINGVPCLAPHIQIQETLQLKKLDKEGLNFAIAGLEKTITAIASAHPAIKIVSDTTHIANLLLKEVQ